MIIILTLKSNKTLLIDVEDYEFHNDMLRYNNSSGEHFLPLNKVKHIKFKKQIIKANFDMALEEGEED